VRDEVAAAFFEKSEEARLGPLAYFPPDGECMAYARAYDGKEPAAETLRTLVVDALEGEGLDAGAELAIHDGRRQTRIPALDGAAGFYRRPLAERFFDKPALYVTGSGGAAVGGFAMPVARPEAFAWVVRPTTPRIRVSGGLTLRWKDAPPEATMLAVAAVADPVAGVLAVCHCAAPAAAGAIRMRPEHLRHLSAGGSGSPGMLLLIPWPSRAAAIPAEGARRSAAVSLYVQGTWHVFR
jgi:hypothetical protein